MADKIDFADLEVAAAKRTEARQIVQGRIANAREALNIARKTKLAFNAMGITVKSTAKASAKFVKRHPKLVSGGVAGFALLAFHKPILGFGRDMLARMRTNRFDQTENSEEHHDQPVRLD